MEETDSIFKFQSKFFSTVELKFFLAICFCILFYFAFHCQAPDKKVRIKNTHKGVMRVKVICKGSQFSLFFLFFLHVILKMHKLDILPLSKLFTHIGIDQMFMNCVALAH